jgi:hypothetical protein
MQHKSCDSCTWWKRGETTSKRLNPWGKCEAATVVANPLTRMTGTNVETWEGHYCGMFVQLEAKNVRPV